MDLRVKTKIAPLQECDRLIGYSGNVTQTTNQI